MKRLAILGASGHGKVVAEAAECEGWENVFFYDDRWPELLTSGRWSVIGDTAKLLLDYSCFDGVVVAIGHNPTRLEKLTLLAAQGIPLPTIVHPNAVVSS
ncbi:MAG: acetyltransferase, partial [Desulfovibrionales bacterium]|nr:acetyltransferase [Desulfovibrionales bacterium]